MGRLQERAQQLKEKRAGYAAILDFYVQVRESQTASQASLKVAPLAIARERKNLLAAEGFSLGQKEDFPVDVEAAIGLFATLAKIGKKANPHLATQLEKIDQALRNNTLGLKDLISGGAREVATTRAASEMGLDPAILSFLVQGSIRPSFEAGMELLRGEVDVETWRKSHCPVCGSPPSLSLLQGEGGKRYSLCSCCSCQWRIDRLSCSVCGNKEPKSLHYFCAEGEEAYRIELCDACRHYIKTIDYRNLEESDPSLEDLATLHLDLLAVKKGYQRAVPNFWLADNGR